MNLPELFATLNGLPLFNGVALGVTMAFLLALTYEIRRAAVSLPLLAAVFGVLGVLAAGFFPPYYGLLVWITGLFAAGLLALASQRETAVRLPSPSTPLMWVGIISAYLLLTSITGLLSFWPPAQIASNFTMSWVVLILLAFSLWHLVRHRHPLPRTVAFLGGLAGLALWQALRLDTPVVFLIWAIVSLAAAFVGPLVGGDPPLEINHESG